MKKIAFLFVLFYGCVACAPVIKQDSIRDYVRQECNAEENGRDKYCFVFIHNNPSKENTCSIFMIFSESILIMEESDDSFQSKYYNMFGKKVSFHLSKDIKDDILRKGVSSIDYNKHYDVEHCLIRRSAQAEVDKGTWKIIPLTTGI